MSEFDRMGEVETTVESLRISFFRENCTWDTAKIIQEEQKIYYKSLKQSKLEELIEVNYVYVYDQDEMMIKKNKSRAKYEGTALSVYKRVFRRWVTSESLKSNDIWLENYDADQNKVEVVILCKKYIPYPRIAQIEDTLDILDKKINHNLLHQGSTKLDSLLSAGCFIYDFYKQKIGSLCKKKQYLTNLEDEIQNQKNNRASSTSPNDSPQSSLNNIQNDTSPAASQSSNNNELQQVHGKEDDLKKVQNNLINCNRLLKIIDEWIWRIIDWQAKSIKYSSMIRYHLISVQYEFNDLSQYFYTQLREYLLRFSDVINYENKNTFLQSVIRNSGSEYIHATPNSQIININCISPYDLNKVEQISIDTAIFKSDFNLFYTSHKELKEQKQKYQYFNVDRTRTDHPFDLSISDNDYPHIYHLKSMHNNKQLMIGIQEHEHSSIELYIEPLYSSYVDLSKYQRFNPNYMGYIDRNYWGTQFVLYNEGYLQPKNLLIGKELHLDNAKENQIKYLQYFLNTQKCENQNYSLMINYETNILADEPRKMSAIAYNYKVRKFTNMKSLEPVYNHKTQSYQLNFYGRAQRASARNFQIQDIDDDDQIFLLHGKNEKNSFSVDFSYPLNIVQAFAFSVVSISKKFLVS